VPGYSRMELSPPNYADWKRLSTSFERMGAYNTMSVNFVGRGEPEWCRPIYIFTKSTLGKSVAGCSLVCMASEPGCVWACCCSIGLCNAPHLSGLRNGMGT